jgi:hypothetical protein
MRTTLLAILIVTALAVPDASAEWRVEPSRRSLASTVIRELGPESFYGFTCFRRRWSFFFNHNPPDGGRCEDHHDCEGAVRQVTIGLAVRGGAEQPARFELTENTYYAADDISPEGLAAISEAGLLTLKLDPRLAEIWGIDRLDLPTSGLREAIERQRRRFDCPVGATPSPEPLRR